MYCDISTALTDCATGAPTSTNFTTGIILHACYIKGFLYIKLKYDKST